MFGKCALSLYSSVVERQSCKLKVLGSIPSGGLFPASGQLRSVAFSAFVLQLCGFERFRAVASGAFVRLPPVGRASPIRTEPRHSKFRLASKIFKA